MTTPSARLGYRDVLQLPHASRLLLAALIGRLSFATVSLAMLLAVQRSTRSYAAAGAAVGAFGLANVIVAPARARLVDRAGQPVALPRLAAGYAALLCLLAGCCAPATSTCSAHTQSGSGYPGTSPCMYDRRSRTGSPSAPKLMSMGRGTQSMPATCRYRR